MTTANKDAALQFLKGLGVIKSIDEAFGGTVLVTPGRKGIRRQRPEELLRHADGHIRAKRLWFAKSPADRLDRSRHLKIVIW
jgi:hypothetical protein